MADKIALVWFVLMIAGTVAGFIENPLPLMFLIAFWYGVIKIGGWLGGK